MFYTFCRIASSAELQGLRSILFKKIFLLNKNKAPHGSLLFNFSCIQMQHFQVIKISSTPVLTLNSHVLYMVVGKYDGFFPSSFSIFAWLASARK